MSNFKKLRLLAEFPKKTPLLQNPEDQEAQKSENLKENLFHKQKQTDLNCHDLDHENTSFDPKTNSRELDLDKEENIDQVSKTLALKRPSYFESLRHKRTLGCSERDNHAVSGNYDWKHLKATNLKVKYCRIYSKSVADKILNNLEKEVQYLKPEDSKVQVYGKWHQIPRKHAAYGERGVTYTFSNTTLPALSWDSCPTILELKKVAEIASGETYNFVLINRYKDGTDYMGEHKDNESDLVAESAISSFSFGQARDFLMKYDKNKLKDRNLSETLSQMCTKQLQKMTIHSVTCCHKKVSKIKINRCHCIQHQMLYKYSDCKVHSEFPLDH